MINLLDLINKLMKDKNKFILSDFYNKKVLKVWSEEKKAMFLYFAPFFDENYAKKLNTISLILLDEVNKKFLVLVASRKNYKIFLNINEISKILGVFTIKAFENSSVSDISENLYFKNSDEIINNIFDQLNNFMIFYDDVRCEESSNFRAHIFRFMKSLIVFEIIEQKTIKSGEKTIIEWSLGFLGLVPTCLDVLKINHEPHTTTAIDNMIYLKGSIFTKVYCVAAPNYKSNAHFMLIDESFIELQTKMCLYIDFKQYGTIKSTIESEYNFRLCEIPKIIKELNDQLIIQNKIHKEEMKKESSNFENLNKDCKLFLFITYVNENDLLCHFRNNQNKVVFDFIKDNFINFCAKIFQEILLFSINLDVIYNFLKFSEIESYFEDFYNLDKTKPKLYNIIENFNKTEIKRILKKNKKKILDGCSSHLKNVATPVIKKPFESLVKVEEITEENLKDLVWLTSKFSLENDNYVKYRQKSDSILSIIKQKNANIHSKISFYLLLNNFNLIDAYGLEDKTKIYFANFFDFRGRNYPISPIGVTNFKYSRYFYHYGWYSETELENDEKNEISKIIEKYSPYIEHVMTSFKIRRKTLAIKESIFWAIIGVAKIFLNKNQEKVSTENLLVLGLKGLEESHTFRSLFDQIELDHYKNIILSFNDDVVLIRPILKDSTASFIQNLIRIMGYKDESSLVMANLADNSFWYDPYSILIKKWSEREIAVGNYALEDFEFFTRAVLKRSIMTKPYAAELWSSYNYFKEAVWEHFKVEVKHGSKNQKMFKSFYNFLETEGEDIFLKHRSVKMVECVSEKEIEVNKKFIISTHDSRSDLTYYNSKRKSYDTVISIPSKKYKKRCAKIYNVPDFSSYDYKKMAKSVRANWVQYVDGLFIRDIARDMGYAFMAIHDCGEIPCLSVSKFIVSANKVSNNKIFAEKKWNAGDKIKRFSIFIFL